MCIALAFWSKPLPSFSDRCVSLHWQAVQLLCVLHWHYQSSFCQSFQIAVGWDQFYLCIWGWEDSPGSSQASIQPSDIMQELEVCFVHPRFLYKYFLAASWQLLHLLILQTWDATDPIPESVLFYFPRIWNIHVFVWAFPMCRSRENPRCVLSIYLTVWLDAWGHAISGFCFLDLFSSYLATDLWLWCV